MSKRRYLVQHDFFDVWSSDMAYILGFITADGCITKIACVEITINEKDIEILEFIRSKICPDKPIYYRQNCLKTKKSDVLCRKVRLSINSKKIVQSLNELGVSKRKTGCETFPKSIPPDYIGDYIRGLFDGDGNVYFSKKVPLRISICSASFDFLKEIRDKVDLGRVYKSAKICNWYMNTSDSFKIKHIMYSSNGYALKRKKDKIFSVEEDSLKILRYNDFEKNEIKKLYKAGISLQDISKKTGRSTKGIQVYASKHNISNNMPRWTNEQIELIKENYDKKNTIKSIKYISEKTNKSYNSVALKISRIKDLL